MMDAPSQVSRILEHGATVHGTAEVVTWTGAEPRRMTYAEVGRAAARLAHALRDECGVTGDERVATFMWNNNEHLVAYFAVPSMGAVLHTLNLRLFPDQVAYIANHAEDRVVLVDSTLIPLLARVLGELATVRHVVVVGGGDPAPLVAAAGDRITVHHWDALLADRPDHVDWPEVDERDAAALCYTSGTTGHPKGVAYSHRSIYLHSLQVCMPEGFGLGPKDRELAIVPMFHAMSWGLPVRGVPLRRVADHAGPVPPGRADRRDDRRRAAHPGRRGADHLDRPAGLPGRPRRGHLLADRGDRRRLGLPAGADARVPRAARDRGHPRLGDDRDVAARLGVPCRRPARPASEAWRYRYTQGRVPAGRGRADRRPAGRAAARRRRRPWASWRSAGRG